MDRFIDVACSSDEGFLARKGVTPKHVDSRSKDWARRQIAAAYDEHSTIIDSLREQLEKSKMREKALITEFTEKFKELKGSSHLSTIDLSNNEDERVSMPFNGEEMPMDEMADTARMERTARAMDKIKQENNFEEFKRKTDVEMERLRRENQDQIRGIKKALKQKVDLIDQLTKKSHIVSKERDFYKKAKEEIESRSNSLSKHMSPATVSLGESSVEITISENPTSHKASTRNSMASNNYHRSPVRNITPLQRLKAGKVQEQENLTKQIKNLPSMVTPTSKPTTPRPSLGKLTKTSLKSSPGNISFERLAEAIDMTINHEIEILDDSNESKDLDEDQITFVEAIKEIFDESTKSYIDLIESLKDELQVTNEELQIGESKMSTMLQDLEHRESEIKELHHELAIAKQSAQNHDTLKGMLQMVANDQKQSLYDFSNLKEELRYVQEERDNAIREKEELEMENNKSITAIQRVMADGNAENEKKVKELDTRIKVILAENRKLKKQLDSTKT